MPIIRYKRKHPLKIRGCVTDQIISHDSRGYTVINEDYISYRHHIYIQGGYHTSSKALASQVSRHLLN